ncbi:unnamed protein product, partial [Scytosiphon promiscuus]
MGKTHDVVINCTSCGKIACVKEGGFGCSFCGSALPSTGREPRRSTSGGGDSGGAVQAGGAEPQSAALKEALERKDRLLLFDRTSASRTRVLDDQGDYFTSHNWLSQGEREKGEAEEKARRDEAASRRGARRQVKMSIDIMGRRVIETQAPQERTESRSTLVRPLPVVAVEAAAVRTTPGTKEGPRERNRRKARPRGCRSRTPVCGAARRKSTTSCGRTWTRRAVGGPAEEEGLRQGGLGRPESLRKNPALACGGCSTMSIRISCYGRI